MNVIDIVAVVAVIAYVMVRQLTGEAIRVKRLIVLPAVLTLVGAVDLSHNGQHPSGSDILLLVVGAVIAIAIGVVQGAWMELRSRDGGLWGRLPRRSVWLWVLLYGSRAVLLVVAHAIGAHVAGGTSADLLTLGVNRLAQAAVVAARAFESGIPFAPEKERAAGGPTLVGSLRSGLGAAAVSTSDRAEVATAGLGPFDRRGGRRAGRRVARSARRRR